MIVGLPFGRQACKKDASPEALSWIRRTEKVRLKEIDPLEMIDFQQWQEMVDLLCWLGNVRSAAITRVDHTEIEVFKASSNTDSPFHEGLRGELAHHYCEAVIQEKERLLLTDARASERWRNAPEIEHHLVSYMGYPLFLPDGTVFGTICLHDDKQHVYSEEIQSLMAQFKNVVEAHFKIARQAAELQRALDNVKQLEGMLPICAHCKKIRDDEGYWQGVEKYVTERSKARFSHSICPECARQLYPDYDLYD